MHIYIFQHVAFEGAGHIADWAAARGHTLSHTAFYDPHHALPALADYDALVVMGGPMAVYEPHAWMQPEKAHLRAAIAAGKPVLGICLGAQLIAEALGAEVAPHPVKEIGWFPIRFTPDALAHPLLAGLPETLPVLHWHGDRFTIPAGAVHLATSEACAPQGFIHGDRVVGLQFHPEMRPSDVAALVAGAADELVPGQPSIQSREALLAGASPAAHAALDILLDRWIGTL